MKIAIIEDNSLMAEMLKDMVTEQPIGNSSVSRITATTGSD